MLVEAGGSAQTPVQSDRDYKTLEYSILNPVVQAARQFYGFQCLSPPKYYLFIIGSNQLAQANMLWRKRLYC